MSYGFADTIPVTGSEESRPMPITPAPARLETESASHPFDLPSFYESWWQTLAGKFRPLERCGQVLLLGKPVVKGACYLKSLRIAGWNNHYYQTLTEARFDEFRTLSQSAPWDYFELYWNRAYTDPAVFELFETHGYRAFQLNAMPCPIIDIGDGWTRFLQKKGANFRRDWSRKMKNAEPLRPELVFFDGPDAVPEFFDRFIPLHQKYWDGKTGQSYLRDKNEQKFLRAWAERLREAGQLQLTALMLGGEVANLGLNIVQGKNLYCLLTIGTGIHADKFPGLLAMHLTIQTACEMGLKKVDIGPGESQFKKKLATSLESCSTLLVVNPKSVLGRVYGDWRQMQQSGILVPA